MHATLPPLSEPRCPLSEATDKPPTNAVSRGHICPVRSACTNTRPPAYADVFCKPTPFDDDTLACNPSRLAIAGGLFFLAIAMALTTAIGSNVLSAESGSAVNLLISDVTNASITAAGTVNSSSSSSSNVAFGLANTNTAGGAGDGGYASGSGSGSTVEDAEGTAPAASFHAMRWQIWVIYGTICGTAFGGLNLNVFATAVVKLMPPHMQSRAVGASYEHGCMHADTPLGVSLSGRWFGYAVHCTSVVLCVKDAVT